MLSTLRRFLLILLAVPGLLSSGKVHAQSTCGSDALLQRARQHVDGPLREAAMNAMLRQRTEEARSDQRGGDPLLMIPVVVHIIHNNGPENISDAMVQQGMTHLNDAFANSGAYAVGAGVDIGIRFCLAQQDTDGMPTTGITRTESTLTDLISETDDAALKGLVRWDPTRYLNIWLVNTITSASSGPAVAGYAYFPSSHGAPEDGIVNEAGLFGSSVDNSKVHIHEAGHYLGLYHTFEGGCTNNNCMTDGDRVCDTPPDASTQPVACSATANSCNTDQDDTSVNNPFRAIALGGLGGQNDLFQDYMDYGLQSCQDRYTNGQRERMRAALQTARASLLISEGCNTGCGISILDVGLPDNATLIFGSSMVVFPTTIGASTVSYVWQVDGNSAATTPTYNANLLPLGDHTLTLILTNTAGACSVERTINVSVSCSVPLAWNRTPAHPEPGETVTFSTWLEPGITAHWFVDGVAIGSGATVSTSFPDAGQHSIYAVTSNGGCTDTTQVQGFMVGSCPSAYDRSWMALGGYTVSFLADPPTEYFRTSTPQFYTNEGFSTLSDNHGEVMIFSNGSMVWDRNFEMMQNGDSLLGGGSSSQAALIVPDPSNNGLHYLFTTGHNAGLTSPPSDGNLRYNVIDMALNGGDGAVTQKNILLMGPTTEKLAAVKHCNGHDTWVVGHQFGTDAFYSYLITDDGLSTVPLVQHVGKVHVPLEGWGEGTEGWTAIGCMKFSQQGDKLALASSKGAGFAQVFNFDAETGAITDPITIRNVSDTAYFGVEFSPNGRNLYLTTEGDWQRSGRIYRYDVSEHDSAAVAASIQYVAWFLPGVSLPTVALAPNDKIYVGHNGVYRTIADPDGAGTLDYNDVLGDALTSLGVNNTITRNRAAERISASGPTYVCNYTSGVEYTMDQCAHPSNTRWLYNGPNTVVSEDHERIVLDFEVAGQDTLFAVRDNGCEGLYLDTILIQVDLQLPLLAPDTAICAPIASTLSADEGYMSYLWNDGSTGNTLAIDEAGTYTLTVTAMGGCSLTDQIVVGERVNNLELDLGPDLTQCYGSFEPVVAPTGYATYLWSTGSTTNIALPVTGQTTEVFSLQVTDEDGCMASDELTIHRPYDGPYLSPMADAELCPGEVLVLQPVLAFGEVATWHWQDNSDLPTHTVWQPGTYWVQAVSPCGWSSGIDSVTVTVCDISTGIISRAMNEIHVMPNPTAGSITLALPGTTQLLGVEVLDMVGQVVLRQSGGSRTVDLSLMSAGLYSIRLNTSAGLWIGRVVRE